MAQQVWTTARKVLGNVVPLLPAAPAAAFGVYELVRTLDPLAPTVVWPLLSAPILAWLGVNQWGLLGNRAMRRAIERKYTPLEGALPAERWFVGIATPSHRSLWDPHEDVGILHLTDTALVFRGDRKQIELPRSSIVSVRRRPNVHTWIGLGGWIAIEGKLQGKPVRLSIEPRDHSTLWANRKAAAALSTRLRTWLTSA